MNASAKGGKAEDTKHKKQAKPSIVPRRPKEKRGDKNEVKEDKTSNSVSNDEGYKPDLVDPPKQDHRDRERDNRENERKGTFFLGLGGKKKELKKPTSEPWTIWLTIGACDPIPFEVDASQTVHDMKKQIAEDEEFELTGIKLHKFRCYSDSDTPLNPQLTIEEQLQDGDIITLKPVLSNGFSALSSQPPHPNPYNASNLPLATTSWNANNPPDADALAQIDLLKKEIEALRLKDSMHTAHTTSSRRKSTSVNALEKRLDGIDGNLVKNSEALDETVKQVAVLCDTLKRLGGIPAVQNELTPMLGGLPSAKSKDLVGHEGPVWTLFHGKEMLFSGSSDQTIKAWDVNTGRLKCTLRGHTSIVHCVAAYNDDKKVVSGSDDKTIKVWDMESQMCSKTIQDDNIACVLRHHRGRIFAGSFKCVKIWDMEKLTQVGTLTGHNHWVRAIAISNGYCYTGGHNSIKVWDLAHYKCMQIMNESCGSIYSVAVNGNMLLAGTYENTVNIWDLRSYKYVRSLPGHGGAVYSVVLHENKLFSGSYDQSIRVWDLNTFKCVQRLVGHTSSVEALALGKRGGGKNLLYSASSDNTIKAWKLGSEA